jgi:DNA-binding transcriptional LysR family regulator
VLSAPEQSQVVKLGVPEDFDVQQLMGLLSGFSRQHPTVRLDTLNGLSVDLQAKLEAKEIDLALVKRDCKQSPAPALCQWPEQLTWVAARNLQTLPDPVPLAVFPQGCIYRERIIHALESAGRRWRIAFASQSLVGIQAAVSAGLGISLLPSKAVLAEHRVLGVDEGFAEVPPSEMALISSSRLLPQVQRILADYLKAHLRQG